MTRRPRATSALDERWRAMCERDAAADGAFVYAVATTGVYCRPSCGARRPRPEHVSFFATPDDAEAAGFRPCKRCEPHRPARTARDAELVARLCSYLGASDRVPSLSELAGHAGESPFRVHRAFKRVLGLTPKAYADARRVERARADVLAAPSVTEAIYDAGFGSSGRFYASSNAILGMTPTRFRARGLGETIRHASAPCSLGYVLVAATDRGVCAILLGDDAAALVADLSIRFSAARLVAGDDGFDALVERVVALVDDPRRTVDVPLDIRGTAFQQRVFAALTRIAPGRTTTYGDLAAALGMPDGSRAVASACAANPLAVAVPCHRVVRADGSVSGYRWGIERKRALLARERGDEGDVPPRPPRRPR